MHITGMLHSTHVYIPLLFMYNTGMLHAHHRYVTAPCNMHNSTMYHRRYSPVKCTRPLCYTHPPAEARIPATEHASTSAHPALACAWFASPWLTPASSTVLLPALLSATMAQFARQQPTRTPLCLCIPSRTLRARNAPERVTARLSCQTRDLLTSNTKRPGCPLLDNQAALSPPTLLISRWGIFRLPHCSPLPSLEQPSLLSCPLPPPNPSRSLPIPHLSPLLTPPLHAHIPTAKGGQPPPAFNPPPLPPPPISHLDLLQGRIRLAPPISPSS